MPIDRSYLPRLGEKRKTYRVQVWVPKHLREIIGTSILFASCKTDSLAVANLRKHKLVHDLKQRLAAAEVELRKSGKGPQKVDPIFTEGLEWRQAFKDEAELGDGGPDC